MEDFELSDDERQTLEWARSRPHPSTPKALLESTRKAVAQDAAARNSSRFWSGLIAGALAAAAALVVTTAMVSRPEPIRDINTVTDLDFKAFDARLSSLEERTRSLSLRPKTELSISLSFPRESLRARIESVESFNPW